MDKKYFLMAGVLFVLLLNIVIWPQVLAGAGEEKLRVAFLDVGQGDAIFIETPSGNQMLIDAGANSQVLRGLGEEMSFFDRFIDVLLVTHPDADHLGGFIDVFERFDTGLALVSGARSDGPLDERFNKILDREEVTKKKAKQGMTIKLDEGVYFEVISPAASETGEMEPNTASVVGKLTYGKTSFLFSGDAPESIEKYLAFEYGEQLQADVLKVGHHGSKTSTGEVFLSAVEPEVAVISAGADNRYGHPDKKVIKRLKKNGSKIYQTPEQGNIIFESAGREVTFVKE
jgi:competence protein ComEC